MASRLAVAFEDYEAYHRTSGNKLCHYIGMLSRIVREPAIDPVTGGEGVS